jgi:hypothetical protein
MKLFGITLGEGNQKVGEVFTFSLPSIISCPGASQWCKKHCNMTRLEKYRPACRKAYQQNYLITKNPEKFQETVIGVLPRILSCFRIHVSGDFYSKEYIHSWIKICQAFPNTRFWAYTRSWTIPELKTELEAFKNLNNVFLFASTDPTMPSPPKDWRTAYINIDSRAKGYQCPVQEKRLKSCLECGYCYHQGGNVIFKEY